MEIALFANAAISEEQSNVYSNIFLKKTKNLIYMMRVCHSVKDVFQASVVPSIVGSFTKSLLNDCLVLQYAPNQVWYYFLQINCRIIFHCKSSSQVFGKVAFF